jgi:predicted porin
VQLPENGGWFRQKAGAPIQTLENLEMKKTLVALAALAATSAFAQTSVTMDGYFDRAYTIVNNTNTAKSTRGLGSQAGTTTVGIKGSEDLGGGLKVGFWISTDWADMAGANQDATATTASSIQTGGFANSQNFLELVDAKMGTLRVGNVNNEILTATTGVASPAFSTGIGSSYSSSFSTHNGIGTGTVGSVGFATQVALGADKAGVRGIRQSNTVKYISPNFSGVTFAYGASAKNDQGQGGTGDTVGMTDMSVRYATGPLDVMYASIKYEVGSLAPTNGALTAGATNTNTILGASYQVMPALKVHFGSGKSSASATTIANSTSTQYGVTYVMGKIDVMAQMAKVDDKNTTAYDRKMTGLGVNYNFSKTARAYLRYDSINYNTALASSGSEIKRTAVGISKSF